MSMTDNQLIQLFLPIINAGLVADGFPDTTVKQSNQPTMQGITTNNAVFFYKLGNTRYGFLRRIDTWNSLTSQFDHSEQQYQETSFSMMALALQNPKDTTIPTASDLINEVASIMQSDNTRAILNASKVGILRVQSLANPYFLDDRENFEASPTFDFTLTYRNDRLTTTPIITPPIIQNIHGV